VTTGITKRLALMPTLAFMVATTAGAQSLATAQNEARSGRVDAAEAAAKAVLATDKSNAEAHALLCSLYSSIDLRDEAVTECEEAASLAPNKSQYALELARTYGNKADHSGALTGMRMVGKIRTNFERAVSLDSHSIEALSDLGEFYVSAPGIVGGGTDKAKMLVPQLAQLSPARAHRLQAMIDAKDKNDAAAIEEYNAAISAARTPEAFYDLANFYRSHKQLDKAAENARLAIQQDKQHGPDTLDAASLLIDIKRDLPTAQTALQSYIDAPQTGVARYARAHVLMANALQATGDSAGAKKEFVAAAALASRYEAARKGSQG
jgi:tetratricopeptide (TPR) repeat protein